MSVLAAAPSAELCPSLFGDEEVHRTNRAARKTKLRYLDVSPDEVLVVHSGDWHEPEALRFRGIDVLKTDLSNVPPRAIIEIDDAGASTHCHDGQYELERDDAIGSHTSVIAILPNAVLVEYEGELRFLRVGELDPPDFSLAWSSPWPMNPYLPKKTSAPVRAPSRKRK